MKHHEVEANKISIHLVEEGGTRTRLLPRLPAIVQIDKVDGALHHF